MEAQIRFTSLAVAKKYNDYITEADNPNTWVIFKQTEYLGFVRRVINNRRVVCRKFRNVVTGQPMYVPVHEMKSFRFHD